MYSPKIQEALVPVLYNLAKQEGKPMTALVNEMLRIEIAKRNVQAKALNDELPSKEVKKTAYD